MQIIAISGNIGRDAEFRTTQQGDKVLSFNVGVQQGWGERASTNWFRCSVWGKRAETLNGKLLKGVRVFASGEFSVSEYEGKTQLNVRVNDLDFVNRAPGNSDRGSEAGRGSPQQHDELNDDCPF
jgi:single-strand DNA-binding protein